MATLVKVIDFDPTAPPKKAMFAWSSGIEDSQELRGVTMSDLRGGWDRRFEPRSTVNATLLDIDRYARSIVVAPEPSIKLVEHKLWKPGLRLLYNPDTGKLLPKITRWEDWFIQKTEKALVGRSFAGIDWAVHTSIMSGITTGRLSSSKPNLSSAPRQHSYVFAGLNYIHFKPEYQGVQKESEEEEARDSGNSHPAELRSRASRRTSGAWVDSTVRAACAYLARGDARTVVKT